MLRVVLLLAAVFLGTLGFTSHRTRRDTTPSNGTCDYTVCGDPAVQTADCTGISAYINCLENELAQCDASSGVGSALSAVATTVQTAYTAYCSSNAPSNGTCDYTVCGDPAVQTADCTAISSYVTCLEYELGRCDASSPGGTVLSALIISVQKQFSSACNTSAPTSGRTCNPTVCGDTSTMPAVTTNMVAHCTGISAYINCLENELAQCDASSGVGSALSAVATTVQTAYTAYCSSNDVISSGRCDYTVCAYPISTGFDPTACNSYFTYVSCLKAERNSCTQPQAIPTIDAMITSVEHVYASKCNAIGVTTTTSSPGSHVTLLANLDMSMLRSYLHDAKLEGQETLHDAQESLDAIEDVIELVEG